jgi:hypothetical protein
MSPSRLLHLSIPRLLSRSKLVAFAAPAVLAAVAASALALFTGVASAGLALMGLAMIVAGAIAVASAARTQYSADE